MRSLTLRALTVEADGRTSAYVGPSLSVLVVCPTTLAQIDSCWLLFGQFHLLQQSAFVAISSLMAMGIWTLRQNETGGAGLAYIQENLTVTNDYVNVHCSRQSL